jgi:DNA-binding cell septation regulator SpoVG
MNVTEVDIAFVKPKDGLVAFASVVLDDALYLGSIGVHQKLSGDGYRLTYPTRKVGAGQFNIFHPIRKPLSTAIEQAIFAKLKNVVSKHHAGHHRPDAGSASV